MRDGGVRRLIDGLRRLPGIEPCNTGPDGPLRHARRTAECAWCEPLGRDSGQ